jgi:hypothetical protein
LGNCDFKLEHKPKEVRAGHFEERWLLSGSIGHTSWHEHILEGVSFYLEPAQIAVEKIILEEVSRQMKHHLEIGNKFANMLSEAIM